MRIVIKITNYVSMQVTHASSESLIQKINKGRPITSPPTHKIFLLNFLTRHA